MLAPMHHPTLQLCPSRHRADVYVYRSTTGPLYMLAHTGALSAHMPTGDFTQFKQQAAHETELPVKLDTRKR